MNILTQLKSQSPATDPDQIVRNINNNGWVLLGNMTQAQFDAFPNEIAGYRHREEGVQEYFQMNGWSTRDVTQFEEYESGYWVKPLSEYKADPKCLPSCNN
jgi:hypothetical protein